MTETNGVKMAVSATFSHNQLSPPTPNDAPTLSNQAGSMSEPQIKRNNFDIQTIRSRRNLRRAQSTRFAIGYRRPKRQTSSLKSKSTSELKRNLLQPHDQQKQDEKMPLCDFKKDCVETKNMIITKWVNLLLIFCPFGIIAHYAEWSAPVTFFLNFFGMIPLASILGDATECLAEHLGETIGGLLNATFGNAVEVVVMVLALVKAKQVEENDPKESEVLLDVVQTSLIGSIFSNSLLVLGCSFVANGIYWKESSFNVTQTSANVSLLMISAFVMLLPGVYTENQDKTDILMVSRAAALILMLMYCCLLLFALHTHKDIGDMDHTHHHEDQHKQVQLQISNKSIKENEYYSSNDDVIGIDDDGSDEDEEEDGPQLTLMGSLVVLCISTLAVSWLSEYLVDSINPMADKLNMQPAFVGIILLPIIGNAVEHITAIRFALKNKMDVSLSIAVGSATQVAMFVVSLAIIVGWIIDLPLSLAFDPFEINLFIYSSIIIFACISDGSSNWLEGVMLLGLYFLIGIAVWHQNYCSGITKVENHGVCPAE